MRSSYAGFLKRRPYHFSARDKLKPHWVPQLSCVKSGCHLMTKHHGEKDSIDEAVRTQSEFAPALQIFIPKLDLRLATNLVRNAGLG